MYELKEGLIFFYTFLHDNIREMWDGCKWGATKVTIIGVKVQEVTQKTPWLIYVYQIFQYFQYKSRLQKIYKCSAVYYSQVS